VIVETKRMIRSRVAQGKQDPTVCHGLGQTGWSILLLLVLSVPTCLAQPAAVPPRTDPTLSRRISFEEARRLVEKEEEGNLSRQTNRFSRTRLRSGQVVEIYYPLAVVNRAVRGQRSVVPGYGIFYPSLAAFEESTRPRHMLEDLIPDGQTFLSDILTLIERLEKRLRLAPGRLEPSPAGLKRVDQFLRIYHATHTTAQTDPRLFQELTALYGETLRRAVGGEWRIDEERVGRTHRQTEPNISLSGGGPPRVLKPWSSVIQALYDEDRRGAGLGRSLEADLASLLTGH
jgi:hypothetical protein